MTISRTWSDESVIDGENGDYWKRPPSIISKKITLKDAFIFSRYPGNWSLQMDSSVGHISKHKYLMRKVKLLIFEAWRKKSQHISIGGEIKLKEYVVQGKMKPLRKKKKSRKYANGGNEDCSI